MIKKQEEKTYLMVRVSKNEKYKIKNKLAKEQTTGQTLLKKYLLNWLKKWKS